MAIEEKGRYTAADCTETGYAMPIGGKVVVVSAGALPEEHPGQLFFCTGGNGSRANPIGRSVFAVSLSNGECCRWFRSDIVGVLKPELLPDSAKLRLSQIRPPNAASLDGQEPAYSGYCFLTDGRHNTGVWLLNSREAMDYVEMQKPYQHRIMLCDREDFCVFEMVDGRLLYPTQEALEAFRQDGGDQKRTGGITMV